MLKMKSGPQSLLKTKGQKSDPQNLLKTIDLLHLHDELLKRRVLIAIFATKGHKRLLTFGRRGAIERATRLRLTF
jgi:hypothetical protein